MLNAANVLRGELRLVVVLTLNPGGFLSPKDYCGLLRCVALPNTCPDRRYMHLH